jgi:hypothetical protein
MTPCCTSGGMFVQSGSFVEMHGRRRGSDSINGKGSNPSTWRMAVEFNRLEPLLVQGSGVSAVRERAGYARWLAFGGAGAPALAEKAPDHKQN